MSDKKGFYKMKHILLFCIFFTSFLAAQPGNNILRDIRILPAVSGNELSYTIRIPYNILVFEKNENIFSAAYEILIEVNDETGSLISRTINRKDISVENYEETNNGNHYSEALFTSAVPEGKIKVNSVISDLNAADELQFPVEELQPGSDNFLKPLIVHETPLECNGSESYRLANYEGNIPYSEDRFSILIPDAGGHEAIDVEIRNGDSVYWSGKVTDKRKGTLSVQECDGIFLKIDHSEAPLSSFIINDAAGRLPEGSYTINISADGNSTASYDIETKWYNRPFSLSDPEKAIKALKYIAGEEVPGTLLKNDRDDYRESLSDYWKKYDPTPGTSFNPLMNEFYERIDYAARNFASVLKKDGINTARGNIFIKFGKPLKIERSSNQFGKIVETWLYKSNKFIFVDEKGTGEFLLVDG